MPAAAAITTFLCWPRQHQRAVHPGHLSEWDEHVPAVQQSFVHGDFARGFTINVNSIKVQLSVTNIQTGFVTNITSTNGLVITGSATNRNVSCPLLTNSPYVAVLSATDANGNPASSTVKF